MPPRDPKPANSGRKPKLKLDVQEPALTNMLEKYCDLRRRGFGQKAIQTKASWPRHYPSLLLKEAQRRKMPGSQGSQAQAVTEWLLAMFDAGTELRVIQRMSAFTGLQTNKQLKAALDAASGPAPTDIIIRNPDGEPTRVSWLDTNGELMHRPFDGAFPAHYPADLAVRQCTEILYRLMIYPNNSARDRAYTMLSMAQAGLHSFDYDSGKWVHAELERTGLDEDAKHTVIMKLNPHPSVGQLLLQRCGMRSKWLTGNGARTLSRIKTFQFAEPVKHPYSRSTPSRPDHQHRSGSPPKTALPNLWTTVNMNTQPYIGVTGIAEPSQAKQLLEKMTSLYDASQLMCGVILSNSRIQGQETDHPNRYPDIETIPSIFPTHARCLNLIHYCLPDSPMIDQLLQKALEAGGPNCHGVQINTPKNVAWTPVAPIEKFSKRNPNAVIILQITRAAVEELLCNPERIAEQCRLYQEATSRFIIDLSAGNAIPINVELSAKIANAIQERMPEASITFAGGLSPQNVARISQEIRDQHTNPFSIDAEGALRTSEDHLNMRAAGLYISQATKMSQTPTQPVH